MGYCWAGTLPHNCQHLLQKYLYQDEDSHAVYLIFDLSSQESFNSIKNYWINEVESYTDESAVIVLIGNKCDCSRIVSEEDVRAFVTDKKLHYYETSAKTATNVSNMFIDIATHLTEQKIQGKGQKDGVKDEGFRKLEDISKDG